MNACQLTEGSLPLLISVPHAGTALTPEVEAALAPAARGLPDTDWHIPQLYAFAHERGASLLVGHYSRYVIDLNRPPDDTPLYTTATTGLFPDTRFDGTPLFVEGKAPDATARRRYLKDIWQPYHRALQRELNRLRIKFGYALLLDAHSIASVVPRLFTGTLPDVNLGTHSGASCHPAVREALEATCAAQTQFSWVLDGRFKGGYITRAYGQPDRHQHALQLELAQRNYMDETPPFRWQPERAAALQPMLARLIDTLLSSGRLR
ncbi:N-formylglutamate deformylase [Pantoea sp. 1.19]|uniref:N-formylglutamate deformylase n=1 Tax=Pantoea sp. 1.19 TaxID=1925589 RepID=UPI000948DCB6|nr:N-formylglutamate deformylase [Pantoea sp. 1.19]